MEKKGNTRPVLTLTSYQPCLNHRRLLEEAQSLQPTDPKRAEGIYHQILKQSSGGLDAKKKQTDKFNPEKEQNLRNQEVALVKLWELYRDGRDAKAPKGLTQANLLSVHVINSQSEDS
ncbi:hypothetical protein BD410DRAFT_845445 [Rickenella mellea]|uniref:26S proteasome regulatory subunit Rpn6 N-terminal domain-containing protein n=1 Tax=Rickenella mellea TaxID=50990 RepID=A0A4Y7PI46_9AGAM|nr:hypothetical protein BD410DRAFT_845445 [Rickenella mellea]